MAKVKHDSVIRVAQIMGKLSGGGVENVVFNYYREIDKTKIQFDFFYDADSIIEPPKNLRDMGANFYKLPPYQNTVKYVNALKAYFDENNYLIVHSHLNSLSVIPLFVAKRSNIPVRIAHSHSVPGNNELIRDTAKNILKYFSRIYATDLFACSEKAGRWLFGNRQYNSGKVKIIKNAVDFQKFRNLSEQKVAIQNKYELRGKFIIGHVGRLTFAKNHIFMLKILKKVLEKRKDAILILIGEGELRKQVTKKIRKMGLENNVLLLGYKEDPVAFYSVMDVLLLPSRFEGLSMTTIESQIAKVPAVVSTAVPKEAVISTGCRRLSLNDDISKWVDYLLEAPEESVNLTKLGMEYDISRAAPQLESFYEKKYKEFKRGIG
ncbi:glycosyltransferase [Lactobacillus sp. AN1001]